MRKFGMNNSFASLAKQSLLAIFLFIALAACGGDSGTSANDDNVSSSSSSSVIPASSGNRLSSSSKKIASSSSTPRNDVKSSSSNKALSSSSKRSDGDPSSSSQKIASSSSVKTVSSSSVILSSSSKQSSSSSKEIATSSSSSRNDVSSSSEYVPFDHSKTHANASKVGKDAYKQFTDPRNGRSYYYIKIIGKDYIGDKDSVTIMAENLNIGEMVLGKDDQNDDTKIERYCYNNDTTLCDEFGGLYQWAEMMQLPSRCNTESCADLIQENHRGICPEGWRLMTDLDFYIAWHAETNSYGIRGTRSSYGFAGNNYSGLSLTGAGLRKAEGKFADLNLGAYWFLPEEFEKKKNTHAYAGFVSALDDYAPNRNTNDSKMMGLSVRCVKLE
ncbi:MAG: FISUMP domain-containing protein [Fibrobacter sp.]|nr:FISUMP domain-containing protein [Fibrobacter sp.]